MSIRTANTIDNSLTTYVTAQTFAEGVKKIKLGDKEVNDIKLGTTQVSKAYLGSTLIFQK